MNLSPEGKKLHFRLKMFLATGDYAHIIKPKRKVKKNKKRGRK